MNATISLKTFVFIEIICVFINFIIIRKGEGQKHNKYVKGIICSYTNNLNQTVKEPHV